MYKEEFCKLLRRIGLRGYQKQPIDRIMGVGIHELGTSLIESLLARWTGWRGKKNGGILQNEDRGYLKVRKQRCRQWKCTDHSVICVIGSKYKETRLYVY
jgi:hypothetical protein